MGDIATKTRGGFVCALVRGLAGGLGVDAKSAFATEVRICIIGLILAYAVRVIDCLCFSCKI